MAVDWLDEIRWTDDGLVPVIAQQADTGSVLMFAWMNKESLALTVEEGYALGGAAVVLGLIAIWRLERRRDIEASEREPAAD